MNNGKARAKAIADDAQRVRRFVAIGLTLLLLPALLLLLISP